MMKFACMTSKPFGVKTVVSLNSIMVDGTGMCGACRVEVGGETRFCCAEGPEFDGHEVDFDLLLSRQGMYLAEEKLAMEDLEKNPTSGVQGQKIKKGKLKAGGASE
jgi:ferredoxin--NADP+ reductase